MKAFSFSMVFTIVFSYQSFAKEGCRSIKCPSDANKIETSQGFGCKKKGTNIDHGPKCIDSGFKVMSGAEGRKVFIHNYKDGKRNGKSIQKLGKVVIEEFDYKDNKPHGKRIIRHPRTGKILEKSNYKDGKIHGKYLKFSKQNGMKIDESYFEDGKLKKEILFTWSAKGPLKKKEIKEGVAGDKVTLELYDDSGELIKRIHKEDDLVLWTESHNKEGYWERKETELLSGVGNCKIETHDNYYVLKIAGEVFAESLFRTPLIKAIEKQKAICESFGKDQDITGCRIKKRIDSLRPNTELSVNNALKSENAGMAAMLLDEAINGTFHLSKAGLCNKLTENKCRASFHEPADRKAKDGKYKIDIKLDGKSHVMNPSSAGDMYYISRILFGSKCIKEYHRGGHCSVRSRPDRASNSPYEREQYELVLGGESVAVDQFFKVDDILVGWDKKFCKDGKVNKCQLKKVSHANGDVSYGLYIDDRLACSGRDCESVKYTPGRDDDDIKKGKDEFQDKIHGKIPKFALKHGCFFADGLAESFLNGIMDNYVKTDREEAMKELERRVASENENDPGNRYRGPDFLAPRNTTGSQE